MKSIILLSTGEVCKRLSVKKHVLVYLLETSVIPEPQKIGGRRLFTEQEVNFINETMERRQSKQGIKNKQLINKEKTNVNPN